MKCSFCGTTMIGEGTALTCPECKAWSVPQENKPMTPKPSPTSRTAVRIFKLSVPDEWHGREVVDAEFALQLAQELGEVKEACDNMFKIKQAAVVENVKLKAEKTQLQKVAKELAEVAPDFSNARIIYKNLDKTIKGE